MKIIRAKIVNYRSIKDIEIEFDPRCRILVGINESGKTNILKALGMLGDDTSFDRADVRQPFGNDENINSSHVQFLLELDQEELCEIKNELLEYYNIAKDNIALFQNKDKTISIDQLLETNKKLTYRVGLLKQDRIFLPINPPSDLQQNHNTNAEPSIPINEDGNLLKGCQNIIHKYAALNLPEVFFWQYNDTNILPEKIPIRTFTENPDSCPPLKNMFTLTGYDDVSDAINNARLRGANGLPNLLGQVARNTTDHLRAVWSEYPDIRFDLAENGDHIDANIRDVHNKFSLRDRSDGFKQFVSFLLMISAKVRKGKISNSLILVDEPGINLHPSGCRYLLKELLNISTTNYVMFSTHSIFLIDGELLKRHIIVEKSEETTNISSANSSNYTNEEVIFNALGYSIFSQLKDVNLIFEGWSDYCVFRQYLKGIDREHLALKHYYDQVGSCFVRGVRWFHRFTPFLLAAERKCLLISDADNYAKQAQEKYKIDKSYGIWLRYDEILPDNNLVTLEDFINIEVINSSFSSLCDKYGLNISLDLSSSNNRKGILNEILDRLKAEKLDKTKRKEFVTTLKMRIYSQIKPTHVSERYLTFLENLKKHVEDLKNTNIIDFICN
jgi:energy-coupling factor transporter ATP-binding protein EcfA2